MAKSKLSDIRVSERTAFKRCQQAWWWRYREGLVPKRDLFDALWFGTLVHLCLEQWYVPGRKRGRHPAETWDLLIKDVDFAFMRVRDDLNDEDVSKYEDSRELGRLLLIEYVKHWGEDDQWEVISGEQTFKYKIPWPRRETIRPEMIELLKMLGGGKYSDKWLAVHRGTFDLIFRNLEDGLIWLMDHKTAKVISLEYLTLDEQAGTYWTVANKVLHKQRLIKPKEYISGILYNFIRKGKPDTRPRDPEGYATNRPVKADYVAQLTPHVNIPADELNGMKLETLVDLARKNNIIILGERSKTQSPPIFVRKEVHRTTYEQQTMTDRMQRDAIQMEFLRRGLLPLTKSPTKDCPRFCSYFDMCDLQDKGGNWQDLKEIAYRVEDPYINHR